MPYLAALFLNAFTDLGHKIIIQNTVFKIYDTQEQIMLTAIVNALVLLPFILLFTPSGYLSDRFAKARIMRYSALLAVVVTLLITACYYLGLFWAAFFFTFILAAQSAFYSPAKYGYIKELVAEKQISAANAAVQGLTTVAILSGIIFYTVLFENNLPEQFATEAEILKAVAPVGWLLVAGSVLEFFLTMRLPVTASSKVPAPTKGSRVLGDLRPLFRHAVIFDAVIMLAVFWSISQVVLAIFGAYAKSRLGVENTIVVQGLMALAGIGIVLGSWLASRFSGHFIHTGLIPVGAGGIFLTTVGIPLLSDLYLLGGIFLLFGVFAGLFIVPLNALIQYHAPAGELGKILAGSNFIQNLFMTAFLVLTTLFAYHGMDSVVLFWMMGALAFWVTVRSFRMHLLRFLWLCVEGALSLRYRIVYEGTEHIPKEGAVLLLGNHISWLDWALVHFPVARKVHYLMDRSLYGLPIINPILRLAGVIPISDRGAKEAFEQARIHLRRGEVVGLFPEGSISRSGNMEAFKKGFETIAKNHRGVIVPFHIGGIYGSRFSRSKKKDRGEGWPRRRITVRFGKPLPMESSAETVRSAVAALNPGG